MRYVCQFSCGAASAVATKLALHDYAEHEVAIINAFIAEEHPDNRRFLADCEKWFGQEVIVLRDETFGASAQEVWRKRRYIKGPSGAACSTALKRKVLNAWASPTDIMVLGFTSDEEDRFNNFIDRNPQARVVAPLVERQLTKTDCLGIINRAGIPLPEMYRLGYANANCVGCCKGGAGYWNKIRRDFPDVFERVARIEDEVGSSAFLFRDRKTGIRYSLRELDPEEGRMSKELSIECSAFCELAEHEIAGSSC